MSRRLTRRSIIGLVGASAAAAVAPVALGWRQPLAEAAGSRSTTQAPPPSSTSATPAFTPPPGSTTAGPPEEITFSGKVDRVLGNAQFIGSGKQFTVVTAAARRS
jgi:hypothetical protein